MASKLGKRGKIGIGVILAAAAIAAVHIFVFKDPAKEVEELRRFRDQKQREASTIPRMPSEQAIQEFQEKTAEESAAFWDAALQMDVPYHPVFRPVPQPSPLPPNANEKQIKQFEKISAEAEKRQEANNQAAEDLMMAIYGNFIAMKEAYESGRPWRGDVRVAENPTAPVMQMSFLESKQGGWYMPLQLKEELLQTDVLQDKLGHLFEDWDLLNLLPEDALDYQRTQIRYIQKLQDLGLDLNSIRAAKDALGQYLPEMLNRLFFVRLIWEQKPEGETWIVGNNEELTLPLLRKMFQVQTYNATDLDTHFYKALSLEVLLLLARKNQIDDIQSVTMMKLMGSFDLAATPEATATPVSHGGMPMRGNFGLPGPGAAGPGAVPYGGAPQMEMTSRVAKDFDYFIAILFEASSNEALNYLYEIANYPYYYRIESLVVSSKPDSDKIRMQVTVSRFARISGLTDTMLDEAGRPVPAYDPDNKVREIWREYKKEKAETSVDIYAVVEEAYTQAGLQPPGKGKK